ncbi:hypothetical protein M9Y10_014964 [Tritrichomonas musculus]|uniref:Serine/threonine-protein kinase PLK n=1 Tax=Tritrichomonas musculus TaxID=1915356 RepID=A0ABR2L218_9EUKA
MSQPLTHVPDTIIYNRDDGTKNVFVCHEKLGHGGFSEVYRVTIQNTNKAYAMKVISKDRYETPKGRISLEKLKNEIQIQKGLNHPNIVQSKISFSDEFNYYIALEFCPGKSIREYLKKSENGRLTEPETRKILQDVIEGLVYLHNSEIIHHDLKLENFLIGSDGKVKIADFGLSNALKNEDERKHSICGTTNYLSPEVILKKNKGRGFEADIWAIGVATFIMLTGKPPFDGGDKETTYENIKNCRYHFPSKIPLSSEAKDFIKMILKVDPSKRPAAIDLIDHPFLTKYDKDQIQFYKPPQTRQKPQSSIAIQKVQSLPKYSFGINNAFPPKKINNNTNANQRLDNIPLPAQPVSNLYELPRRSSNLNSHIATSRFMNEPDNSARKANLNTLNIDYHQKPLSFIHENNELNAINNSKKNFTIPNHFITKYYFHEENLGYLLGNGTVGVCFYDQTRIVMDPNEEFVQYYKSTNSTPEVINLAAYKRIKLDDNTKKHQEKISLLKKFAKSFKKYQLLYDLEGNDFDPSIPLYNVKYFLKKDGSVLFKLNDKNVQVNFSDYKKMIIFWNTRKMCVYTSHKDKCNLLDMNGIAGMNENCDEHRKLKNAKDMLVILSKKIAQ